MNHSLCVRTVIDARARTTKYLYQVLLLAASWHKHVRHNAPLEVMIVGEPPEALCRFLESLGVFWTTVDPDPNDAISKTSNTIVGAVDTVGRRILLVDNDVMFWGDLSELMHVDGNLCQGSVAGAIRVADAQWKVISEHLGFSPLPSSLIPLGQRTRAVVNVDYQPKALSNVYVNGGVLLLPEGDRFGIAWRRYVREIAELFERHALRTKSVYGSNMAGLAMAIADHGRFEWLDLRYNYRADCFVLGLESPEQIEIVHLTGFDDSHRSVTKRIEAYWQGKMMKRFGKVKPALTREEQERRLAIIDEFRQELLSLVREYDLDGWGEQLPKNIGHLWETKMYANVFRPLKATYGMVLGSMANVRRRLRSAA